MKQLAMIGGKPMLQHAIDAANSSFCDYVLLVVGSSSSEILSRIDPGRAQVVLNKNFEKGQSTSIKCGITNIPEDSGGAIIMVGDQPYIKSVHLNKMIKSFKEKDSVVILSHEGKPRNPVLIPKKLFSKLATLKGDTGAKALVRKYNQVRLVEIRDEKVFFDVDTKREYSKLRLGSKKKSGIH